MKPLRIYIFCNINRFIKKCNWISNQADKVINKKMIKSDTWSNFGSFLGDVCVYKPI